MKLATEVILLTKNFTVNDEYTIGSQIKRSAISIASNIAEGSERKSKKEFIQFLSISLGSLAELKTQIYIAVNINLVNKEDGNRLINEMTEIHKMIHGFRNSVKEKLNKNSTNYKLQATN